MMSKEDFRRVLAELPNGSEISLKDMMRMTDWHYKDLLSFLDTYTDRELKVVRSMPKRSLDDFFYFPNRNTYPVFQIFDTLPEPEPQKPPKAEVRMVSGGDILVPIQRFSERELVRLLVESGLSFSLARETIEWWQFIGHAKVVQTPEEVVHLYGPTMIETVGNPPTEVEETVFVDLPKRNWWISRKGGFFDWLENTFGWSRSEAVLYFDTVLRGQSQYLKSGYYKLPSKIPLKRTRMVISKELKPIPTRLEAVLRWFARTGGKNEYNQEHEIDAFIRLPQSMTEGDVENALAELMDTVLNLMAYPPLEEILDSWHEAVFNGVTTDEIYSDGYYRRMFKGTVRVSGLISEMAVKRLYLRYGIMKVM